MKFVHFFQTKCLRDQTKRNSICIPQPRRVGNTGLSYGDIVEFNTETEASKFRKHVTLHKRNEPESY
jgi:hypothetical protein